LTGKARIIVGVNPLKKYDAPCILYSLRITYLIVGATSAVLTYI
jgi:hypothetical protein